MLRITNLIFLLTPVLLWAGNETCALRDMRDAQVKVAGFTLNSDQTVSIHAMGAGGDKETRRIYNFQQDPFNMFAYAWIIDAHTRQMVWRMTVDNTKRDWWNKWRRTFEGGVRLKKGEYELYLCAIRPDKVSGFLSFERILDMVFGDDDWWEEQLRKWYVEVRGVDAVLSEEAVKKYHRAWQNQAIVSLESIGDGNYEKKGFSVTQDIDVDIYAIGEGWQGEMFDYGWILDMHNRKKVWRMRERKTSHAGGAIKNRVARDRITLPAGDYMVYYRSDDNHSAEKWNTNPPYDPDFWGIMVRPADSSISREIVREMEMPEPEPLIQLIRMGDDDYREAGLIVKEKGAFRIHALGEGRDNKMYDYGWISDAETGEEVWRMTYRETEHAGGSGKNRLFDGVITLPPGSYIVHYKTDDSHSYKEWNSTPPRNGKMWGITLYPMNKNQKAEKADVASLTPDVIIAELTRARNDEHLRKRFSIDKRTVVRIVALGEGDWDEMYDYGWIEDNSTHRKVWRMRYRNTDRAGGASKNRKTDTIITLEPGSYTVHYVTDDSHSFNNWNATPPDQPYMWGITIYKIED
ncbi:MAG: hypothetical protein D6677_01040 [Calditrichaeota bacterium]|nr:MAG: hypothetical protein D6677_01040 [Calditrichota bacterium]